MATGFVVSGRGDLDVLFKPRVGTAGANTGFRSNGGVDLAQRFEPRGSSTAIANTNYKAGANDLASIFMDIAGGAPVIITRTFTMGNNGGSRPGWFNTDSGYAAYPGQSAMSPSGPDWAKSGLGWRLDFIDWASTVLEVQVSHASVAPGDNDGIWEYMRLTGVFASSGGASVTRTLTRASRTSSVSGGATPNGRPRRDWDWNPQSGTGWDYIGGNAYTLDIG